MSKYNKNLQKALSISSTILGSVLFCLIVGYILYQKSNNLFWLLFFALLGIMVGLYESFKQINK
tara:strand:+ start:751 stop:942 length:192 start_codon:yes stop_codon:yes gene_type:complete